MRTTGERFDYDLAVIGGGSGGYAAARTAVAEGLKTVVLEGGEEVGGLCILRGCMPTKALLYAAEVMHLASHPEPWGIRTENVSFDFAQVMARKNALIKDFADYRRAAARQRQVQVPARPRPLYRPAHARTEHGRQAHRRKFRHCHRVGRRPLAAAAA